MERVRHQLDRRRSTSRPARPQRRAAPAGSFQDNQPLFAFAGIGQGDVATTPLQMALVAAGIANGGVIMSPHVGAEIRDADDDLVRRIDDQRVAHRGVAARPRRPSAA